MDTVSILTFGFALALIIGTLAYIILHYRMQGKKAARFATELGTDSLVSGKTYEGELNGRKYFYEYYTGSKNNPSYFKLWLECQSEGEFKIVKEGKFDVIFKNLGIANEIQTGDSDFNKRYYIQTDAVQFTRAYLDAAEHRDSIKELFNLGFSELFHDGEILEIKKSPFSFKNNPKRELVEKAVAELYNLNKNVPEGLFEYHKAGMPVWKIKRALIYTVAILSVIGGFSLFLITEKYFIPLDQFEVLHYSLKFSLLAFILFIFIAIRFLRGRSSSHKHLMFNFLIALFGFPIGGYGTVAVLNGYLDPEEISYHYVPVTGKRISTSKDSKTYYIKLQSWRHIGGEEEIKVSSRVYDEVEPSLTRMIIGTKPGHLDFEWLVSYEIDHNTGSDR